VGMSRMPLLYLVFIPILLLFQISDCRFSIYDLAIGPSATLS
jgi:hypothetical protein